jgi:hypothetical protein
VNELWQRRHQQLTEALKQAALDLLAHQNIAPARMEIPLGEDLWITIGKREDSSVNNDV